MMKKSIKILIIAIALSILFGCTAKNNNISDTTIPGNSTAAAITSPVPAKQSETLKIADYFPMKENCKYIYEGKGNEYASYSVYIDYISNGKIQERINNGGTETVRVFQLKDNKLTRILSRPEAYYRENLLSEEGNENEVVLMEPLTKGTKWTLKNADERTITNTSVNIATPSGNYTAIEVTTSGSGGKTVDYYAKNIGLVKSVFSPGQSEVSSSLAKIEENVSFTQSVNFYYTNLNDDKIYFKSKDISFRTNDDSKQVFEKAYKELVTYNIGRVFTTNTKINSLYFNRKDNIVYIDLNKAFLTELKVGARFEKMVLQSIADTFGQYYSSDKVVLTIDDKPYESGHIKLKKGEYLKVDLKNTVEIKK
jgi:hypothetical protein